MLQLSVNSGFGGIHGAILSLSTRCLGSGRWIQSVKPLTDTEVLNASIYATSMFNKHNKHSMDFLDMVTGYGTETKFETSVRHKERLLRKSIIGYIGTASDFTGKLGMLLKTFKT